MTNRRQTREQLIAGFQRIKRLGWIQSKRPLNDGGIGNTIDYLLGFEENNFAVADTAQWELKTHRAGSSSLVTLLHMDPKPRAIVPRLIRAYGWPHDEAGTKYSPDEMRLSLTLRATEPTDRGFRIGVSPDNREIRIVFDPTLVDPRHAAWLIGVQERLGLGIIPAEPHWNVQDVALRVSTKMLNSFFVDIETRRADGQEMFSVRSVLMLQGFDANTFLRGLREGTVYIDFDARTHHNHGTKFRLREDALPKLYAYVDKVA